MGNFPIVFEAFEIGVWDPELAASFITDPILGGGEGGPERIEGAEDTVGLAPDLVLSDEEEEGTFFHSFPKFPGVDPSMFKVD